MKKLITTLLTTTLVLVTSVVFSQGACEGETSYAYQGVTYDLIEIGDQCWFSEPIRTMVYTNLQNIEAIGGSDNEGWTANTSGAVSVTTGGDYLYNWYAIDQGVCPTGYDVPTDKDFMLLEAELGVKRSERNSFNYRGTGINFKANWFEAGFDINFSGIRVDNDGALKEFGNGMYMWTLDAVENDNAIDRAIFDYMPFVARHNNLWQTSSNKGHGMLAMCVKNDADEQAAIEDLTFSLFVEPGPSTIEGEDFLSGDLNEGDTLFIDESLTQSPPAGTQFTNSRREVLVVNQRGALVNIDNYVGDILTTPGGPQQNCGCIVFNPDGTCYIDYKAGPASSSCVNICQNAGLSWSGNAVDWKRCGFGQTVAPSTTKGFDGTTFVTPKGRQYEVTKYTDRLWFDELPDVLVEASQLEQVRAYVDQMRTIPYSYEKVYSPSRRVSTINPPKPAYVLWDDPFDVRHGFRVSETTGYLIEIPIEDIPTGAYPYTFPCQCWSCESNPSGIQVPMPHNVLATINSGALNCTNACANGTVEIGGEIINGPGWATDHTSACSEIEPVGPDASAFETYFPVFGDTTLSYNDQYISLHVLDTLYTNVERTIPAKKGISFLNRYDEILFTDENGVLRRSEHFNSLELVGLYGDPVANGQQIMICCNNGVGIEVVVCADETDNCDLCKQRGYDCYTYNCQIIGFSSADGTVYDGLSDYLQNSGDVAMRKLFLDKIQFRVDTTRSQVADDINSLSADMLDSLYFDLKYQDDVFNDRRINSIVSFEANHFSWLSNIPLKINDLYYAFDDSQMLRVSTANGGTTPDDSMLPTEPGGGELIMCLCCCDVLNNPYDAEQLFSGPSSKGCRKICKKAGCVWTECDEHTLFGAPAPLDNSGGTWDGAAISAEIFISRGDSSTYYNELGASVSVFDTIYVDAAKRIPLKQGHHFISERYGILYTNDSGVLLTEDLYRGYKLLGTDQKVCECTEGLFFTKPYTMPCGDLCATELIIPSAFNSLVGFNENRPVFRVKEDALNYGASAGLSGVHKVIAPTYFYSERLDSAIVSDPRAIGYIAGPKDLIGSNFESIELEWSYNVVDLIGRQGPTGNFYGPTFIAPGDQVYLDSNRSSDDKVFYVRQHGNHIYKVDNTICSGVAVPLTSQEIDQIIINNPGLAQEIIIEDLGGTPYTCSCVRRLNNPCEDDVDIYVEYTVPVGCPGPELCPVCCAIGRLIRGGKGAP